MLCDCEATATCSFLNYEPLGGSYAAAVAYCYVCNEREQKEYKEWCDFLDSVTPEEKIA